MFENSTTIFPKAGKGPSSTSSSLPCTVDLHEDECNNTQSLFELLPQYSPRLHGTEEPRQHVWFVEIVVGRGNGQTRDDRALTKHTHGEATVFTVCRLSMWQWRRTLTFHRAQLWGHARAVSYDENTIFVLFLSLCQVRGDWSWDRCVLRLDSMCTCIRTVRFLHHWVLHVFLPAYVRSSTHTHTHTHTRSHTTGTRHSS